MGSLPHVALNLSHLVGFGETRVSSHDHTARPAQRILHPISIHLISCRSNRHRHYKRRKSSLSELHHRRQGELDDEAPQAIANIGAAPKNRRVSTQEDELLKVSTRCVFCIP